MKLEIMLIKDNFFVLQTSGIYQPSVYHALVVIFLEFFSWGLLTSPIINVSGGGTTRRFVNFVSLLCALDRLVNVESSFCFAGVERYIPRSHVSYEWPHSRSQGLF